MNYVEKTIELLERVARVAPDADAKGLGICRHVELLAYGDQLALEQISEIRKVYQEVFKTWPRYSGDPKYPIPAPPRDEWVICDQDDYHLDKYSPDIWDDPRIAYTFCATHAMWSRNTTYGRSRWELLEYTIAELKKLV